MNIQDVKDVEVKGDKLDAIFERQKELLEKYQKIETANGFPYDEVEVDLDSAKQQLKLKEFAWRITEELGEAMSCLKNKPWKSTHMETDKEHYYEEIADAFHFFIELCIISGIDAKGLSDLYFRKAEVNKFRQRSNY